jgi:hypothetical protein
MMETTQWKGMSMERRLKATIILGVFVGLLFFSQLACAHISCLNPTVKTHDDSKKKAIQFIPIKDFSLEQKTLIDSLLKQNVSQEIWDNFTQEHNDQAATFLAVTNTLRRIDLFLSKTQSVTALDMVEELTDIRGVRLIANVNLDYFSRWVEAGGHYAVRLVDQSDETGSVPFADHSQKGGGLHCGFDIQGYTHYTTPPYIHWNVNQTTGSSDIHLDGRAPWILGFIPNPRHLEYDNSDVREWMGDFEKKYGSPGFVVREN